jgi:hypothetical protein
MATITTIVVDPLLLVLSWCLVLGWFSPRYVTTRAMISTNASKFQDEEQ